MSAPDHQHPSPAGDELVERLEALAVGLERNRWGGLRDLDANTVCTDSASTAVDIRALLSALVSERSARQAAEERADKSEGDKDEALEILDDLVRLDGEEWATGGGPGFRERYKAAWDRARDLVRVEP